MNIVAFTGKKGCGKSFAALQLAESYDYVTHSFADPIREICRVLGITDEYLVKDKNAMIPHLGKSARFIMQTFGTEYARDTIKKTIWLDMMAKRLSESPHKNVCVDDVRFDNEAKLIKKLGGIVLRIKRGDTLSDNHVSEHGISDDLVDYEIDNDGAVTLLFTQLTEILENESFLPRQLV